MSGITPADVLNNNGPNTADVLAFLDALRGLTGQQYGRLADASDYDDMDRWKAGADAGVKAATAYRAGSRDQRAWYLARHAAEHVLEEREDLPETPGNPNYYLGYVAAAVCYRHLLTTEHFDGLTEPWTSVMGPL